jgi:hypothetical protein
MRGRGFRHFAQWYAQYRKHLMGGLLAVERTTSLLHNDHFAVLIRAVTVIGCPSVIREDGGIAQYVIGQLSR